MSPHARLAGSPEARRWAWADGRVVGVACAVSALLIWASWFAITRVTFEHVLGPADVTVLRFGGGSLVLVPLVARELRGLSARLWCEGVVLALLWGVPFVLLVAFGIRETTAVHAALVTPSLNPLFAVLLGRIFRKERPGRARVVGVAVIAFGVGTQLVGTGPASLVAAPLGNLALMTASLLWAGYTLRLPGSGLAPLTAAAVVALVSALGFLPIYLLSGVARLADAAPAEIVTQVLYQGILTGGLSVVAFNKAVAALGPIAAAAIAALVPVTATLIAALVLGEMPAPSEAVASLCVAGGVFLIARGAAAGRR